MGKWNMKIAVKRFLAFSVSLTVLCAAGGCSYKEVDDKLQQTVNPEKSNEPGIVKVEEAKDEDIHYVKLGERFSDYMEYSYSIDGEQTSEGVKGLEYTVNNIQLFDTVYDSGIEKSEWEDLFETDEDGDEILKKNNFILVDLTAYYNEKEAVSQEEIVVTMDFVADFFSGNDKHKESIVKMPKIPPELKYFSEHVRDGDINIYSGTEMNEMHQYRVFRHSLKPGDTVNFQVGIFAAEEWVEQKNVFLALRFTQKPGDGPDDDPLCYMDLIGEYLNEKNTGD